MNILRIRKVAKFWNLSMSWFSKKKKKNYETVNIRLHLFYRRTTCVVTVIQISSAFYISFTLNFANEARLANGRPPNPNVAQPQYYGTLSLKPRFTFMWSLSYSVSISLAKKFRFFCFRTLENVTSGREKINAYIISYMITLTLSHATLSNALFLNFLFIHVTFRCS